ncbi:MAG TPA: hypothetical protein OIM65_02240 [Bacilli bacterium]|jgi:hypothetical protein|nr:hypothetical protein [Bacilli bacterium]
MSDLIEVYTRLKMKTNCLITLTFFSSYGYETTKKYKLIDIVGFSYILVENEEEMLSIPFFGKDTMIKDITIDNSKESIYFNKYVNENIFNGFYVKDGYVENIKQNMLGNLDFKLEDRNKFIQRYKDKTSTFEYEDLFFSLKQKQEFNEFFKLLIKDLTNYCKNNGLSSELNYIGKGTTSIVYGIGDKIIKIGKPRRQTTIPYCEYLLQPIINRDFEFDGYPIHVEVTQKVIMCDEVNSEIVKKISEYLHNIGLKATDLHPNNLGFLTKDNKVHYKDISFDVGNSIATSIDNNNNLKVRKAGEIVIIDLDCLEIEDVDKYTKYLESLGFSLENNSISKSM